MVTKHITDEELQLFALDKENAGPGVSEHIHVCEECRSKVEVYRSLVASIGQQPEPIFEFNLSELVMEQLPASESNVTSDKLLRWILISVSAGFVFGGLYYFRSYLASLFEGVTTILIYLIGISALTVITVLVFDMYKKFKREMKVLDLY